MMKFYSTSLVAELFVLSSALGVAAHTAPVPVEKISWGSIRSMYR